MFEEEAEELTSDSGDPDLGLSSTSSSATSLRCRSPAIIDFRRELGGVLPLFLALDVVVVVVDPPDEGLETPDLSAEVAPPREGLALGVGETRLLSLAGEAQPDVVAAEDAAAAAAAASSAAAAVAAASMAWCKRARLLFTAVRSPHTPDEPVPG